MTHAARSHRLVALIGLGVLGALAPGGAGAQSLADSQLSATPTVPNSHDLASDRTARLTVPVTIGGQGPFNFMIDTGAERTVISRQLRDRLALKPGRPLRLRTVLGAQMIDTAHLPGVRIGDRSHMLFDSPVLEADHIGADGILGLDMLRAQRVTFDFRNSRMQVAPSTLLSDMLEENPDDDVARVAVGGVERRGALIFTQARIKSITVPVVIDTGAEVSIGNPQLKRLLSTINGNAASNPRLVVRSVDLSTVAGERGDVELMAIDRLSLDGIYFTNLVVAFVPSGIFAHLGYVNRPAILLGMDALRKFDRVQIDFAARKVRFDVPLDSRLRPPVPTALATAEPDTDALGTLIASLASAQ